MMETGTRNPANGPASMGLDNAASIAWNMDRDALIALALKRGEGEIAAGDDEKGGPLSVSTGRHTGRSATDKYLVRDAETEDKAWWDNNNAMSPGTFRCALCRFRSPYRRAQTGGAGSVRRSRP